MATGAFPAAGSAELPTVQASRSPAAGGSEARRDVEAVGDDRGREVGAEHVEPEQPPRRDGGVQAVNRQRPETAAMLPNTTVGPVLPARPRSSAR